MIAEDTPPGTRVVCVEGARTLSVKLVEGEVYTVAAMRQVGNLGVLVSVAEANADYSHFWFRRRFRRLDLPECLTRLQKVKKVREKELVE